MRVKIYEIKFRPGKLVAAKCHIVGEPELEGFNQIDIVLTTASETAAFLKVGREFELSINPIQSMEVKHDKENQITGPVRPGFKGQKRLLHEREVKQPRERQGKRLQIGDRPPQESSVRADDKISDSEHDSE